MICGIIIVVVACVSCFVDYNIEAYDNSSVYLCRPFVSNYYEYNSITYIDYRRIKRFGQTLR